MRHAWLGKPTKRRERGPRNTYRNPNGPKAIRESWTVALIPPRRLQPEVHCLPRRGQARRMDKHKSVVAIGAALNSTASAESATIHQGDFPASAVVEDVAEFMIWVYEGD